MLTTVRSLIKAVFVACLLGLLFTYAMFQGGFVSWFLFYSVTSVVVFTVFVSFFPFRVKKVERFLSQSAVRSGDNIDVTINLEKHRLQPFFFLRIKDQTPKPLKSTQSSALFFFSFQRQFTYSYQITHAKRGVYTFHSLALIFSDLFGFIERRTSTKCESVLYVLPKVHKLKALPFNQGTKELEGKRAKPFDHAGRSISGVRKYIAGDRITSIDWKQSARSAHLMTKEFEALEGEEMIVAFDPYVPAQMRSDFERMIELVASVLVEFAERKSAVHLALRSDDWIMTTISKQSLTAGLKQLAQVSPHTEPIEPVHAIYHKWKDAHVAFLCMELNEEIVKACETMLSQKVHVTIYMLAGSERDEELPIVQRLEKMRINLYKIEID